MGNAVRIRANSTPWWNGVHLLVQDRLEDGQGAVGTSVVMQKHDSESPVAVEPTMTISTDAARVLMDDLWACGIRPSEAVPARGEIEAVKYHLEDMRRLLFLPGLIDAIKRAGSPLGATEKGSG